MCVSFFILLSNRKHHITSHHIRNEREKRKSHTPTPKHVYIYVCVCVCVCVCCRYLYLLFDEDNFLHDEDFRDDFIFNTEGHLLPLSYALHTEFMYNTSTHGGHSYSSSTHTHTHTDTDTASSINIYYTNTSSCLVSHKHTILQWLRHTRKREYERAHPPPPHIHTQRDTPKEEDLTHTCAAWDARLTQSMQFVSKEMAEKDRHTDTNTKSVCVCVCV